MGDGQANTLAHGYLVIQCLLADPSRTYSPPLDGIRAIAILAVMVFHVSPNSLRGGFTGVDVFFVLSGFLLGGIVLQDIATGSFSMREFYLRRIQRLAPEMILTVLAVLLLWSVCLPPSAAQAAGRHGIWTLANLSNFYIWKNLGGYWGESAALAPLLHTWSLAVEEQFYLFFPGFLLLLARFGRGSVRFGLLLGAGLSLGLCVFWTPQHGNAAFYMLPARVWELLLGAALAAAPAWGSVWLREAAGWAGLVMMVAGFVYVGANGFPGYLALVPVVGALLTIFSAAGKTTAAALLSAPPLVWTGKLSYAIYLWHWPLIILGRFEAELHGRPAWIGAISGAVASVLAAAAAYAFVERPLRSRGPGRGRRLAAIGAAFVVCLAASAAVAKFTPQIDTARYFDMPSFYGRYYSAGRVSNELAGAVRFRDVFFPSLAGRADNEWQSGGVVHLFGGSTPEVVVLGSSHGAMYAKLIDEICRDLHLSVSFLAVDGAPIFFDIAPSESFPAVQDCDRFNQARRRWLETWHPRAVFLIERWDTYATSREAFETRLRPLLEEVGPSSGRMIFVAQPPVIAQIANDFNLREWAVWRGLRLPLFPDGNQTRRDLSAAVAERAQAEYPKLRVLRPDRAFLETDGAVRWARRRTVYYADDDHLSQAGAETVREMFQSAIEEAAKSGKQ